MNIKQIIELKYTDLSNFCNINVIQSIENRYGITDIEEIDILHSIILKYLVKYKNVEYSTIDEGYQLLKKEFLGEKSKYTKKQKVHTKYFVELNSNINNKPDDIDLNDI